MRWSKVRIGATTFMLLTSSMATRCVEISIKPNRLVSYGIESPVGEGATTAAITTRNDTVSAAFSV
jgi:hypothetical protein